MLLGLILFGSEATALDFDGVTSVEDTIEDGGSGFCVITENGLPFGEDEIGCEDGGAFEVVAFADNLKEDIGTSLIDWEIADFVDLEERGFDKLFELGFESRSFELMELVHL